MSLAGPGFSALIVALDSLVLESFLSFSHVYKSHLGTEEDKIWPRQTVSRPVLHLSRAGVVPGPRPRAAHKHGLCRNLAKVSSVRTGKRAHCRSPVSECTGCTVRSCPMQPLQNYVRPTSYRRLSVLRLPQCPSPSRPGFSRGAAPFNVRWARDGRLPRQSLLDRGF